MSDIIVDGSWAFPSGTSDLQQIWDSVTLVPRIGVSDHYVWKGHSSGKFSIDSAWNVLRDKRAVNSIHHLLWFPGHIPRHSFILWLASLGRLRTMDRLQAHGLLASSECILCGSAAESHEHLFLSCDFSSYVWGEVSAKTLMAWPSLPWFSLLQWTV